MRIRIQYSDLVLIGILCSLLFGVAVGYVTSVPTTITVPVAALIGIALIYHAIFRNGPVNSTAELTDEAHEIELPK